MPEIDLTTPQVDLVSARPPCSSTSGMAPTSIARAALDRAFPGQSAYVFENLSAKSGAESIGAVRVCRYPLLRPVEPGASAPFRLSG
jgi:hypothetical protein